jgi:hypothetical protein
VSDTFNFKWQPNGSKIIVYDASGLLFKKKFAAFLYDAETGKQIAVLEGKKKIRPPRCVEQSRKEILTFNNKEEQIESVELSVWTENGEL